MCLKTRKVPYINIENFSSVNFGSTDKKSGDQETPLEHLQEILRIIRKIYKNKR